MPRNDRGVVACDMPLQRQECNHWLSHLYTSKLHQSVFGEVHLTTVLLMASSDHLPSVINALLA